jgi:hypothetical protein
MQNRHARLLLRFKPFVCAAGDRRQSIDAMCAMRAVARSGVQPMSDAIGGGVGADGAFA